MVSDSRLREWYEQMLTQTAKADTASQKWQHRRAWLAEYMKVNAGNYATEKVRRDKLSTDFELQDAMDAWNWYRREANRLGLLIQAEYAMRRSEERRGGKECI